MRCVAERMAERKAELIEKRRSTHNSVRGQTQARRVGQRRAHQPLNGSALPRGQAIDQHQAVSQQRPEQ